MSEIAYVTDRDFQSAVLESGMPVLVEFRADWSDRLQEAGHLRLEELADEYGGRVNIVRLDIETSVATPRKYSVHGLPTLLLFQDGIMADRIMGVTSKEAVAEILDKAAGCKR